MKEQNGNTRASCSASTSARTFSTSLRRFRRQPVQKARFRRETLQQFFDRAHVLIGMNPVLCSQWLARKLMALVIRSGSFQPSS